MGIIWALVPGHGKLTLDGQVLRSQKTRLPEHYMQHYRSGAPPVFQAVEAEAIPFGSCSINCACAGMQ